MTPQTQIRLMKEFPQINTDVAKEIQSFVFVLTSIHLNIIVAIVIK